MRVHHIGWQWTSTYCMLWLHLYTAPQPHRSLVGSWGSCSYSFPGCCDRNEASKQQRLVLCLKIPDGRSHFGAPRGMCQSYCQWLAWRPSTRWNLKSFKYKMSAEGRMIHLLLKSHEFSIMISEVTWSRLFHKLGAAVQNNYCLEKGYKSCNAIKK